MHRYDAFIGGFLLTVAVVYGSVVLGMLALYLILQVKEG